MGRVISNICELVCLAVCVCVHTLKGKRLELSTLVHVYSMSVAQHALTQRSKGQGEGYTITKNVMVTCLLAAPLCYCCWHGTACRM